VGIDGFYRRGSGIILFWIQGLGFCCVVSAHALRPPEGGTGIAGVVPRRGTRAGLVHGIPEAAGLGSLRLLPSIGFVEEMTAENSSSSGGDQAVRTRLLEEAVDGRIECGLARRIAEESGIGYSGLGRIADELKIKIKNCQLGCF